MQTNERCLTDLLVCELEPELTSLMQRIDFTRFGTAELNSTDQFFLKERRNHNVSKTPGWGDFRDPNDVLNYEHKTKQLLLQIMRHPRRGPYIEEAYYPPHVQRIFGLTFRYSFSQHPEIQADQAERIMPPQNNLVSISSKMREVFEADHVYGWLASPGPKHEYRHFNIGTEFTTARYRNREFYRDYEGMPPDVKVGQFYFNMWLEYATIGKIPLEGQAKADAVRKIPAMIAMMKNISAQ